MFLGETKRLGLIVKLRKSQSHQLPSSEYQLQVPST